MLVVPAGLNCWPSLVQNLSGVVCNSLHLFCPWLRFITIFRNKALLPGVAYVLGGS